jgi:methylated-DNA-[protein]-cysteine S-methyltransferase
VKLEVGELGTPLGDVRFARSSARILALAFAECWPEVSRALARRIGTIEWVAARDARDLDARLRAYFAGDLATLSGVEVELAGTAFQRRVWSALRGIPPGQTTSYGALARSIGATRAARAVGAANGANPLWLLVPCHRAIGADGRLTGYAGGVERKRWLLAHESRCAARAC